MKFTYRDSMFGGGDGSVSAVFDMGDVKEWWDGVAHLIHEPMAKAGKAAPPFGGARFSRTEHGRWYDVLRCTLCHYSVIGTECKDGCPANEERGKP